MKILLINDDGVYSSGLKAAYEALSEFADVTVVAPITQMSAVGRSISIMRPVRMSEVDIGGIKIYAVDGTPTDCIVLGIYEIIKDVPDLTICGINLGENLSTEAVTTSGTVCAALEAATHGSKAIAISLEMPDSKKFDLTGKQDFSLTKSFLAFLAKKAVRKFPDNVDVLNVNVPKRANGKIMITRLARSVYRVRVEKRSDPRGRKYYWIYGQEVQSAEPGTDIFALKNGYISVTPISLDMTSPVDFNSLKRWLDEWEA